MQVSGGWREHFAASGVVESEAGTSAAAVTEASVGGCAIRRGSDRSRVRARGASGGGVVGCAGRITRAASQMRHRLTGVAPALAACCLCAAVLTDALAAESGPPPTPAWPSDAELEAQGARIGSIVIRNLPIFDPSVEGERRVLFQLADRLHRDTRKSIIENHLLFQPGDSYSRQRIEETKRNLRELPYLREPEVRIVGYHDGLVDLEVAIHEAWTTNPGVSFGRTGGENTGGISLKESNLLGFGKQLQVSYSDGVDRDYYTFKWTDPAMGGSRWSNEFVFRDSDDGNGQAIKFERPFYSLDARWSAGMAYAEGDSIDRVYRLGDSVAGYARASDFAELLFGRSNGLRNGWARRLTAGFRHENAEFALAPDEPAPVALPGDRRLDYPFLRLDVIQDDFETTRNLDQIAMTEDLHFGLSYGLEFGWARPEFGADRSAGLIRAAAARGFRLGAGAVLLVDVGLSGRLEESSLVDGLLSAKLRFYRSTGPNSTFVVMAFADAGHELDADHEVSLGGDNGLRGYPNRYQTGNGRALITVEQRYYSKYSLWKLADIGGAVFLDVGRSWGDSVFGPTENQGCLGISASGCGSAALARPAATCCTSTSRFRSMVRNPSVRPSS